MVTVFRPVALPVVGRRPRPLGRRPARERPARRGAPVAGAARPGRPGPRHGSAPDVASWFAPASGRAPGPWRTTTST